MGDERSGDRRNPLTLPYARGSSECRRLAVQDRAGPPRLVSHDQVDISARLTSHSTSTYTAPCETYDATRPQGERFALTRES